MEETSDRFHDFSGQSKQTETALKSNMGLKALQYDTQRPVLSLLNSKRPKYSRKFLAEHGTEIELYRAAQEDMKWLLAGEKLPKMEVQKEEGRKLLAKKNCSMGNIRRPGEICRRF